MTASSKTKTHKDAKNHLVILGSEFPKYYIQTQYLKPY